jgi:hypothetical protein
MAIRLLNKIIDSEDTSITNLDKNDYVVVLGGSNDINCNESETMLSTLETNLSKLMHTNVIVGDFPMRYDLAKWSCVNREIRKANKQLQNICGNFSNVKLVSLSSYDRNSYTNHGQHLNGLGKNKLCNDIVNEIVVNQNFCLSLENIEIG